MPGRRAKAKSPANRVVPFYTHMRAHDLPAVFMSGFLAVFFLHAGLDKILDRKGNVMRYRVSFDQTPMRKPTGLWLSLLTLGEMLTGVVLAAGALALLLMRQPGMAFAGTVLGAMTLLFFFAGLRLGKDQQGAAATVPYFVTCVVAMVLLGR